MNDWLTSLSFHVNQPSYSSNKASSNFDHETSRSRSWVWSKGKTIQWAQYLTDLLSFCFTSIRKQFLRNSYFEIWPWKIKDQGWGQRSRSYSSPSIQPMHHLFASHPLEQPLIPEICPIVFDLEKTHPKIWQKTISNRIPAKSNQVISMTRGI